jgi:hypothetical protein
MCRLYLSMMDKMGEHPRGSGCRRASARSRLVGFEGRVPRVLHRRAD